MPRIASATALLIALLAAGCGGSANTKAIRVAPKRPPLAGKPQISYGAFHSRAVKGTLHFSIALPPGYASSRKRYPVVYFLHGLPAGATAYRNISGYADSLASTGHRAIVVGAQGARAGDTDPEWHDWRPGRDWETATDVELVNWIDHHYRTLAKRSARAIVGTSAGGYGAALIAIHHPETYQVIESWSGYFFITDPDGHPLRLDNIEDQLNASAHASVPHLKASFAAYPRTFFGFYIGSQDPFPGFLDDNVRLSNELTAAGVPHFFRVYEGAHNNAFWASHQDDWLGGAVDRLDQPS